MSLALQVRGGQIRICRRKEHFKALVETPADVRLAFRSLDFPTLITSECYGAGA